MPRQARRDDRRGPVVRGKKILCHVAVRSWDAQGVGGTVSGDDDVIGEPDVETEGDDGVGCVGQVICIYPYPPQREISYHFKRSPVMIGEAMIKVEDLLRKDKSFEKVLKHIGKQIVDGRKKKYCIPVAYPSTP